jgi:hypothetical protein
VWVIAEATSDWTVPVVQFGSFGLLAFLLMWYVRSVLPKQQQTWESVISAFKLAIEKEISSSSNNLDKVLADSKETRETFERQTTLLRGESSAKDQQIIQLLQQQLAHAEAKDKATGE